MQLDHEILITHSEILALSHSRTLALYPSLCVSSYVSRTINHSMYMQSPSRRIRSCRQQEGLGGPRRRTKVFFLSLPPNQPPQPLQPPRCSCGGGGAATSAAAAAAAATTTTNCRTAAVTPPTTTTAPPAVIAFACACEEAPPPRAQRTGSRHPQAATEATRGCDFFSSSRGQQRPPPPPPPPPRQPDGYDDRWRPGRHLHSADACAVGPGGALLLVVVAPEAAEQRWCYPDSIYDAGCEPERHSGGALVLRQAPPLRHDVAELLGPPRLYHLPLPHSSCVSPEPEPCCSPLWLPPCCKSSELNSSRQAFPMELLDN